MGQKRFPKPPYISPVLTDFPQKPPSTFSSLPHPQQSSHPHPPTKREERDERRVSGPCLATAGGRRTGPGNQGSDRVPTHRHHTGQVQHHPHTRATRALVRLVTPVWVGCQTCVCFARFAPFFGRRWVGVGGFFDGKCGRI